MRASSYNNKKSKRLDFQFLCSPVQCGLVQSNSVEPRSKSVHFKSQGTVYGTMRIMRARSYNNKKSKRLDFPFHYSSVQCGLVQSSSVKPRSKSEFQGTVYAVAY